MLRSVAVKHSISKCSPESLYEFLNARRFDDVDTMTDYFGVC
jgi:hypothetical protein